MPLKTDDEKEQKGISIPLVLVLFLIAQTSAGIWWAASMTANQAFTNQTLQEQKLTLGALVNRGDPNPQQDFRLTQLEKDVTELRARTKIVEDARRTP